MRLAPHLADAGDVAKPDNAEGGDEPEGVHERHHAFVPQHAPDEGRGHRRRRLGQSLIFVGIDA